MTDTQRHRLILLALLALLAGLTAGRDATAQTVAEPPAETEATAEPAVEPAPEAEAPAEPAAEGQAETKDAAESAADEAAEEPAEAAEAPADDDPDNPGQSEFDQALETKISAETLNDLNEVVDLIDASLDKGLDADNTEFAEQVLVATLLQRAASLSGAILNKPVADPQRDPRWLQVRQFALTDLQRAVSLDESQLEAWFLIGRLQSLYMGSKSEARRALGKVIRLADEAADDPEADPVDPKKLAQAYALRGAAQKEDPERTADFTRAIEIQPDTAEYRLLRAKAHQAAGRPDECLADIDHALTVDPDNAKVHEMRALVLLMQEKPEEALESFERASELAPQMLSPYQYRGEVYSQLGKLDEAIAQLDKALELSPNNLASLLIRAELLMASDENTKALADIDAALAQSPGLVRAHLMKARALDLLDRGDEAVAWLERLASLAPERVDVQLQLAAYYVDKSLAPEAIASLTRVLEIDDSNELARRLRGDMYLLVGKHAEALGDFARAMEQTPEDPGVLNNFAWTLSTSPFDALRDGERAVELATKACEATGYDKPHILSTLAAAYAEAGDFEQAIRWSQEAINKSEGLGTLDSYDGQLTAELDSYRAGQPWRELQQQDAAPSETPDSPGADDAADDADRPADPEEPASETPPARSFDF